MFWFFHFGWRYWCLALSFLPAPVPHLVEGGGTATDILTIQYKRPKIALWRTAHNIWERSFAFYYFKIEICIYVFLWSILLAWFHIWIYSAFLARVLTQVEVHPNCVWSNRISCSSASFSFSIKVSVTLNLKLWLHNEALHRWLRM